MTAASETIAGNGRHDGFPQRRDRARTGVNSDLVVRTLALVVPDLIEPVISAPTEKSLPSPLSTTARTSRMPAKREKTSDKSRHIASVTAFFTEGRLRATCAMPSRRSILIAFNIAPLAFDRPNAWGARLGKTNCRSVTCISRLIRLAASSRVWNQRVAYETLAPRPN